MEFHKQSTLPHLTEGLANGPLPETIGPYKIESLLSSGGMSLLYLGLHPETKTPLAVKVLSPKFVTHEELVDQFLKEAEIVGLADHPNIVKLYGQGQWEQGLYIAMEFIQGVSLRQFIMQRSLSLRRALDIVLQVAYALLHLHTHSVIHRDLKPENILITENGQVKVIDFGIAQLKSASTLSPSGVGGIIGTPTYMSPEQQRDPLTVGFNADIYALGVITYELITGKLSFGNINLDLLPATLKTIIEKALRPNPEERTHDIVDFITEISDYLKSDAIKEESTSGDEISEMLEELHKTQIKLLPNRLLSVPEMDLGIARTKNSFLFGLYYDIFRLKDGSYLTLLAESKERQVEAMVHIGSLRGTLLSQLKIHDSAPFSLGAFVTDLNDLLAHDHLGATFGLSALHFDLSHDRFSFISCGESPLWHLSTDIEAARLLLCHNPLLGADRDAAFEVTSDSWIEGDTLVFHSFNQFFCSQKEAEVIEAEYRNALLELRDLSCQSQAEAIYARMHEMVKAPLEKQPKAILSIQRIQ